jgi:hemerythrin-like domain-containing protein
MYRATESLEREHRMIEKIVKVMSILVDELTDNRKIHDDILRDLGQFLRVYGNQCHHGKEESCLFPLLETRGVPEEGCPLGTLRHEHERSRALTQALVQATVEYSADPYSARPALMEVLRELVRFYPAHIWKEEYLLFPLADKVLSAGDQERLLKEFANVESDIYSHAHESFEQLADDLEERAVKASPKMRTVSGHVA